MGDNEICPELQRLSHPVNGSCGAVLGIVTGAFSPPLTRAGVPLIFCTGAGVPHGVFENKK